MNVECEWQEEEYEGTPAVSVICPECGYCTRSMGTGVRSIRRCLALLREQCPRGEKNFYCVPETKKE